MDPADWGEKSAANYGCLFQEKNPADGYESKPWYLVNPKIAGKWMFIPLKMYLYVLTHTHIYT
jgi:hypothetical protein